MSPVRVALSLSLLVAAVLLVSCGPVDGGTATKPGAEAANGEAAAITQELATAICGRARTALLHAPYPGKMATAGNLALPFTPLEIPLGEVCAFNVYHLMEVDSPTEPFPIELVEI